MWKNLFLVSTLILFECKCFAQVNNADSILKSKRVADDDLNKFLMSTSQHEKVNIFYDATEEAEPIQGSLTPSVKFSSNVDSVRMAVGSQYLLSSLQFGKNSLLFWRKPDVLMIANRIIAGEDILRIPVPLTPNSSISDGSGLAQTNQPILSNRPEDGNLSQERLLGIDPWAGRLSEVGRGILGSRNALRDNADEMTHVDVQENLSRIPLDIQQLAIYRAQQMICPPSPEVIRARWISKYTWAGAVLSIQSIPNPVVKRADLNQPREKISLLTVSKTQFLDDGKRVSHAGEGIAVLK